MGMAGLLSNCASLIEGVRQASHVYRHLLAAIQPLHPLQSPAIEVEEFGGFTPAPAFPGNLRLKPFLQNKS